MRFTRHFPFISRDLSQKNFLETVDQLAGWLQANPGVVLSRTYPFGKGLPTIYVYFHGIPSLPQQQPNEIILLLTLKDVLRHYKPRISYADGRAELKGPQGFQVEALIRACSESKRVFKKWHGEGSSFSITAGTIQPVAA